MKKMFLLSLVLIGLMFFLSGCGNNDVDLTEQGYSEEQNVEEQVVSEPENFDLSGKEFVCDYSQDLMGQIKYVVYYGRNNELRAEYTLPGAEPQVLIITSKGSYHKSTPDMKAQTGCDWILWEEQDGVVTFDMDMYERKDLDESLFNKHCEFKDLDDSLFVPDGKICTMESLIDQAYGQ